MKKIKKGDLVFTRLKEIEIFGREEDNDYTPPSFRYAMKSATDNWTIILLKYLGNGLFQEFSTGELIDIYGCEDNFNKVFDKKIKRRLQPCTGFCVYKNTSFRSFYYLTDSEELKELQKYISTNNPMLHLSAYFADNKRDYFMEIDDRKKLEYLKTSDDERRELINKIKKDALDNIVNINAEINYVLANKEEFTNFEVEELHKKFAAFQRRR